MVMIFPKNSHPQDKDMKKIKRYFKMDLPQLLKIELTTAGKKKEKITDIPASVVVLTREEVETYGYQTLPEILENIPGLYITDDYINLYTGIRGFWSINPNRNVIILVNGIPYKEELSSLYYLESLPVPVEAIDRIEVVRGPMSVIYGNGAFFGVINIITNRVVDEESKNMISSSLGSEKSRKIFARVSGKNGKFQYVVNGSYSQTAGLDVSLEKIGGEEFAGLSTKDKLERSEKFFNFSGKFENLYIDASFTETQKEMMFLYPSVSDGTMVIYNDLRLRARYKKKLSKIFTLESKLDYFLTQLSADYDMLFPGFYGTQENKASGFKGELILFVNPTSDLSITVGLDYLRTISLSSNFVVPLLGLNLVNNNLADGEAMITQSIFTQVDYAISKKLKIVAGAMLEQTPEYTLEKRIGDYTQGTSTTTQATFSYTQVEFIPRLALIYSPDNRNIFKLLYGKAINRPSFFQNLDLITAPGPPPLTPETIHTLELNYIAQLSPKLTINMSLFRNILDKLIYRTIYSVDDSVFQYYSNLGEMTTNGGEVSIIFSPSPALHFEVSGMYQDTQDKRPGFEDSEVAYSPKFLGYLKTSYFFNKNISLAINGNYVDSMKAYWDSTSSEPRRLGEPVKGYFLLGANLRIRKFLKTGIYVNLRFSNIFDKEIHYAATAGNNLYASKGTIGRGRSFLFSLGWKF